MIVVNKTIISDDIKRACFVCDLAKCKGACCIEGDAGAPIEEEEISILEDSLEHIIPYMREEGIKEVKRNGVFDFDDHNHYVTPLVNGKECAFVVFDEEGIAGCAIEKAWKDEKIKFRKPISCHLYPIRVSQYRDFEALNYHEWHICKPAVENGKKLNVPLYKFLKDAIIHKYGEKYYDDFMSQMIEKKKK